MKEAKQLFDETVQKEAERRAHHIADVVAQVLKLSAQEDLSINDLKVVMNEVLTRADMLFHGRKVAEFLDKEDVKALEEVKVWTNTEK